MTDHASARTQLAAELAHWRDACDALRDLDSVAAPAAWAAVEQYLSLKIRDRLNSSTLALASEAVTLERLFATGASVDTTRAAMLNLRHKYLQVETVLDFYGDAVNTRTSPALASLLRGLDVLAFQSLDAPLRQLGQEAPPVLTYVDKGLGASILRAGVRLWDDANPSPVAAIKVTRHNLSHFTAIFHECGHQFGHQTGWNAELADRLETVLRPRSAELATLWRGWVSEVASDVFAFVTTGSAPLPALANVLDGTTAQVYRFNAFDPHPIAWLRVIFNGALCRRWYGAGPWDTIVRAWWDRHPPDFAPLNVRLLIRMSLEALSDIVDTCVKAPMHSFGGRTLENLCDPRRVAPGALAQLVRSSGGTLLTSDHLRRTVPLLVVAHLSTLGPRRTATTDLRHWVSSLDPTGTTSHRFAA